MCHSGTVRHSSPGGINGEAQSPRSVGLVDGRPRAHRLRTDQAQRIAHAAAVELEVWKPTAADQLGLAVKSPWCRRYAYRPIVTAAIAISPYVAHEVPALIAPGERAPLTQIWKKE